MKVFGIGPHEGIRTKRYKLIHFLYGDMGWELFDLIVDPNELNNLYRSSQNKKLVNDLKASLTVLKNNYMIVQ